MRKSRAIAARVKLITHHSLLITHCCFLSLFRQRVKIVSFFLKQAFLHQSFHRIEDFGARLGIVFTGLEQSMQIELLFLPMRKAAEYAFFDFIHGGNI